MKTRRAELLWWLWHSEKLGAQVALLLAALVWMIALLLPHAALDVPNYEYMRHFGNDVGWAVAWGVNVLLQVIALRTRARKCFLAAGIWACTLHSIVAYNFITYRLTRGEGWPVGVSSEIALALVAFVLYVFAPNKQILTRDSDAGLHQGTG